VVQRNSPQHVVVMLALLPRICVLTSVGLDSQLRPHVDCVLQPYERRVCTTKHMQALVLHAVTGSFIKRGFIFVGLLKATQLHLDASISYQPSTHDTTACSAALLSLQHHVECLLLLYRNSRVAMITWAIASPFTSQFSIET
jgi:hypothetical protein